MRSPPRSQQKAEAAIKSGRFKDEIVAVPVQRKKETGARRHRRASSRRHHRRVAGRAASRVRQGRHRHRRKRERHQRWRRGGRGDERVARKGRAPRAAGANSRLLECRRGAADHGDGTGAGGALARCRRPGWSCATSTCSSSTRPSPRRRWRSDASSRCRRTGSTSTAGRSRIGHPIGASGTRILVTLLYEMAEARRRTSASPPCASAAARASRWCWSGD